MLNYYQQYMYNNSFFKQRWSTNRVWNLKVLNSIFLSIRLVRLKIKHTNVDQVHFEKVIFDLHHTSIHFINK